MGVRFDADGEAHQDILDDARLAGDGVEALDFGHRVQDDVPHPSFDRGGQLGHGFIVAVKGDPLGWEVSVQRNGQLPAGAHVQREAFFVDPACYFAAQEGLGRIVHVGAAAECGGHLSAATAEVFLVDDEQRGPVLVRQVRHFNASDAGDSVVITSRVAGPHIRRQPQ